MTLVVLGTSMNLVLGCQFFCREHDSSKLCMIGEENVGLNFPHLLCRGDMLVDVSAHRNLHVESSFTDKPCINQYRKTL